MRSYLIILAPLLYLFSCSIPDSDNSFHAEEENDQSSEQIKGIVMADLPIIIDTIDYLIHPTGICKLEKGRWKSSYESSGSSYSSFLVSNYSQYMITGDLSNIKFQHKDSNSLHKLTEKKMKICLAQYLYPIHRNIGKQKLIYEVIDADSDKDGELSYADNKSIYISNSNGYGFVKLTSSNTSLIDWRLYESLNRIYFRTMEDKNSNGQFDKGDIIHYKYIDFDDENEEVIEYFPI